MVAPMTDMATCPWTGRIFPAQIRGGNKKVFVDSSARAEAHKAARLFAEHLIAQGFLTWADVRRWYAQQSGGLAAPCTTPESDETATYGA